MDPTKNPYAPGAGTKPPMLAGRDEHLTAFRTLLGRLENGVVEQSMIITGLRGVGKTVLLDTFRRIAEDREWVTVDWEVEKNTPLGAKVSARGRKVLLRIAPRERWKERARRAAAILTSFSLTVNPDGAVTAGLDVDPMAGAGDSGVLSDDLTDLLVALGEAAQENRKCVVFFLDEIQYLEKAEFEALIMALHKCSRDSLPITLVGAGLPQIPKLAGEAKTYSERLFQFPRIGKLDPETDARDAISVPARDRQVAFEPEAIDRIVGYTEGYPYFLQLYGKIVWDEASASPITSDDARSALPLVEKNLDESFFRVRAERATEMELRYLFAMAKRGSEPQRAKDVARAIRRTTEQAGPIKSRLIEKGLLFSPGHGLAAFTVPQFDRYMLRHHAHLDAKIR